MNANGHHFQDDFLRAILAPPGIAPPWTPITPLTQQPGFKVYRNTVLKGCVDALAANFPTVLRLVGEDWFRAAALIHVCAEPPRSVCLIEYGQEFADFLSGFEPAAALPYLPDVARLDRLWTESHLAADDEALDAAALATLNGGDLLGAALRPCASVRWRWFETPAFTIWRANREQRDLEGELEWIGEGALLTRPEGAVVWQHATQGMCAFLDACAAGASLQIACQSATIAEPGIDIARLLATLLGARVFADIHGADIH
ncbi:MULTISPECIES: DNA-binding domain-containing protein [Cupriavidus]|jgi:Putative DNA-binding domain|uniref:HvfC/BufC N-terminal domain-containing protein n=1 Tax=Cupriavidus TaxID=106589 RepID=UPI00046453D7|nr:MULTISPECIES: DNA-binding domain-containing protein [Cupriavidus]KWR83910.1 thioredoxin [Cupriavidus sp. SHE]QWC90401.1 putative DNA-binding domain-containing protein [Cupriavidus metallidurans]